MKNESIKFKKPKKSLRNNMRQLNKEKEKINLKRLRRLKRKIIRNQNWNYY